jgi:hypothetical protein
MTACPEAALSAGADEIREPKAVPSRYPAAQQGQGRTVEVLLSQRGDARSKTVHGSNDCPVPRRLRALLGR